MYMVCKQFIAYFDIPKFMYFVLFKNKSDC